MEAPTRSSPSQALTSYTDTSVINGRTYYYVVSAVNAGGEGPHSNEVIATPPLPPVPDPQIGYVSFPATSLPIPYTSVFTPVSSYIFYNDALLIIEGTPGSETYYTYGYTNNPTLIPDPTSSSASVPSDYEDGLYYTDVLPYAVQQVSPYLTIKAIGEKSDGSPNSAVVEAFFQFKTGNPVIIGNNASLFTISDITANAHLYYTIDGSDPSITNANAVDLGTVATPTNVWTVSFNIQTNTLFKVIAYRDNYQPSAIVTNLFTTNNFQPNIISFGFASGEASSEFITSPGETFYAPVTMSIIPNAIMYSLQFNVTVTNAGPNPGPSIAAGAYGFQSMLVKPLPPPTNFPPGVQLYETIPPYMYIANAVNPPPPSQVVIYDTGRFINLEVADTNFNLLAVGWLERYTQTNLYNTLSQDLIQFSQAHDDIFLQANGKIIVGGYAFTVPTNALPGQTYQIQIGRPSATSDGIGTPGSSVYIYAPTNGSRTNGAVNSVKTVTLGQIKYLVGDVYPFRWFNAGDFGSGDLVTNGNADAEQVFEAAGYSIDTLAPGSDFFDAMDSCGNFGAFDYVTGYYTNAGPLTIAQENALFGGDYTTMNQIAFGDGVLDVCDVFVTFMRSEDPALTWYRRFWTNGARVAITQVNPPSAVPMSSPMGGSGAKPAANNNSIINQPQVNFAAGDSITSAGQTLQIPITANIFGIYPLRMLMLNLSVVPLDGSPALTSAVQFSPASALGTPWRTDSHGNGNYAAAWLPTNGPAGLTGNTTLGTLTVTVPANATAMSAYAIHFDHASASPNGVGSFPKQALTGLITLSSRNNSSYGDGIPDLWRLRWFGTTNDSLSVSNGCPSGDGINNWKKYVAGVDPNTPNDFPSLQPTTPVPPGATAAICWPTVIGKHYVILRSTSLFPGNWSAIATNTGTGTDMEFDDTTGGKVHFYRVQILP